MITQPAVKAPRKYSVLSKTVDGMTICSSKNDKSQKRRDRTLGVSMENTYVCLKRITLPVAHKKVQFKNVHIL